MTTMQTEVYDAFIEAGTTVEKARAAAESLTEYRRTDEIATKADIAALRADLITLGAKTDTKIAALGTRITELDARTETKIAELDAKIDRLDAKIDTRTAELEARIAQQEAVLTWRITVSIGINLAALSLAVAILKFL